MSDNQYDDSAKGGYSYAEKLKLVSEGLMDPKEIGLTDQQEAENLTPKEPKLGDYITFECSEVPVEVRARWALKDQKIEPANPRGFMADWIENCKDHVVQARIRSGNMQGVLGETVNDPMLGMIILMRQAAELIEEKYVAIQASLQSELQQGEEKETENSSTTEDKTNE